MKRNLISIALFAVLAIMAASCHKENLVDLQTSVIEVGSMRTVLYTVNGVEQSVTLYGDDEWDAFVDSMLSLAQQGYDVRLTNQSAAERCVATKDVQTFTTKSREEAREWAKDMAEKGYTVDMTYTDGLYVVLAIK